MRYQRQPDHRQRNDWQRNRASGWDGCDGLNAKLWENVTGCLASQARHEMGAPVELFAGAKRRAGADLCGKVREGSRKFAQIRAVVTRLFG